MAKISVIVPIYNVETYLYKCLSSLSAQTFRDFEVIAIDDCSTDNSINVFKDAIAKLNFAKKQVRLIRHKYNRGLSAARNTGINESDSPFVYFLDSDDSITPDCLEVLYNNAFYRDKPVDMVVGNYIIDGPEIGCPHIHIKDSFLSQKEYIRVYCKELVYPMAWNRLIYKDFIKRYNLYFEEGLIHEDTLWNFMVLDFVNRVKVINHTTYIYLVRPNSLQSSKDFYCHFNANIHILCKMTEIMFHSPILKYNKYVYDFVEKEKHRHLSDCIRSGNPQLVKELYKVCRSSLHYNPVKAIALFGYHFGILKRIFKRDLHYLMPFEKGLRSFESKEKTVL